MIIVITGHRTLRYGLGKSSMLSVMMLSQKGALQIGATITIFGVAEHLCNYSRAPTVERCGGTDATKAVVLVCFDRQTITSPTSLAMMIAVASPSKFKGDGLEG